MHLVTKKRCWNSNPGRGNSRVKGWEVGMSLAQSETGSSSQDTGWLWGLKGREAGRYAGVQGSDGKRQ